MKYGKSHHRRDQNQTAVMKELAKMGVFCVDLSSVGKGCPDLACAFRGRWLFVELKSPELVMDVLGSLVAIAWRFFQTPADNLAQFVGKIRTALRYRPWVFREDRRQHFYRAFALERP